MQKNARMLRRTAVDRWIGLGFGVGGFLLYAATAAPSVATLFADSLKF